MPTTPAPKFRPVDATAALRSRPDGFAEGHFSTEQLARHERFPFWKETICDVFANVEIAPAGDVQFRAAIDWQSADIGGGESAVWTAIYAVPLRCWA